MLLIRIKTKSSCLIHGLVMRSFRQNGRKPCGAGTSWVRHDHARRQSSNTAIASLARDAEPGDGDQSEDGREVVEAGDG